MALENADKNYFKISKVVGVNDSGTAVTVYLEQYKDAATRENITDFDKKITHLVGLELTNEEIGPFITALYSKIKELDDYKDMTDV